MFIKELNIKNFKCFNDQPLQNFNVPDGKTRGSGLNILIGENGNGKTTILESLNYLTLNSFSAENKLNVNDFNDFHEEIEISAMFDEFECKSNIDFYKDFCFKCKKIQFKAKCRDRKERNKVLSSCFDIHNSFEDCSQYLDKSTKVSKNKDVDSRDKYFNNSSIIDDGINVFYFDKNRTRQISTGNYKTTFEKILDDLNWKFINNLTLEEEENLLTSIQNDFFSKIQEITDYSAGNKTAGELQDFFSDERFSNLKIEILNLLMPYTNAFFALRENGSLKQIQVKDLGSGIEIILTLLLLKNISNESKGSIIYLIDEPELHLHPKAQKKLLDLLLEESKDKQIFISTHSPYMFKDAINQGANLLILKRTSGEEGINIVNARDEEWGLFQNYSPTWGEINWFAYDLPTVEFHNELYGYLKSKAIDENVDNEKEQRFDEWLERQGVNKNKQWIREQNGRTFDSEERTLQTYIRNTIHHPENILNEMYTSEELRESIKKMIEIIKIMEGNDQAK